MRENVRSVLQKESSDLAQVASEAFKWILGSLLVLNGGALVALANSESLQKLLFGWPGAFYVIGILSALISGMAIMTVAANMGSKVNDLLWADKEPTEKDYDEFYVKNLRSPATGKIGILLIISTLSFVLGCGFTAWEATRSGTQAQGNMIALRPE